MTDPALPETYLAVVLDEAGSAPRLTVRAMPEPAADEALVRVRACGLCGSDLFLQDGGFGEGVFPVVPGHEAAGEVVRVGADVTDVEPGDDVALHYIDNDPIGAWVRAGLPHLGPRVRRMGVDVDGALAQFVLRPARTLVRPRAPILPMELAVLTDAVATPYHALTAVARLQRGESVVVLGCGGIGSNAVQLAAYLGGHVVAVGRSQASRELAADLGAQAVVESGQQAPARVRDLTEGGADVVLVCTDAPEAVAVAVTMCRPRGRLVLVAATRDPLPVSSVDLIWPELTISGSRGFTADDIRAVQNLYLDGVLRVDHLTRDVRSLYEVPAALEDLRAGGATRIVIAPWLDDPSGDGSSAG